MRAAHCELLTINYGGSLESKVWLAGWLAGWTAIIMKANFIATSTTE